MRLNLPRKRSVSHQPLLTEEIKRKYGKRNKKNPFRNNRVIRIYE